MTTRDLLKSADAGELLAFLADYAERDSAFENAVRVRFQTLDLGNGETPDFASEVAKIADMVDEALTNDDGRDYRRRGWGYISVNTSEVDTEIRARIEQGHIRLAFAELEAKYRRLLDAYEYQDECEISDEAEYTIDQMSKAAEQAKDAADQEYIFDRCIALCELDTAKDYGADYEDRFLKIASPFVTPANRAKFEAEISKHNSGWRAGDFKLIQLNMIRRLDSDATAEAYIAENLETAAIRQIAYDAAMACEDYAEAERLCAAAPDESNWRGASQWLLKLLAVHERTGNLDKQADVCERILLKGDTQYYDKLKSLLEQLGRWEANYQPLLAKCESQLSYSNFMSILDEESELDRLMEQVGRHRETVFFYGKRLSPRFGDEVRELFMPQLSAEAAKAGSRKEYAALCSRIATFAKAGYAPQANALIAECKLSHKRQPAFVDELNKLGRF
jgi:hypothetical protein